MRFTTGGLDELCFTALTLVAFAWTMYRTIAFELGQRGWLPRAWSDASVDAATFVGLGLLYAGLATGFVWAGFGPPWLCAGVLLVAIGLRLAAGFLSRRLFGEDIDD